MQTIQTNLKLKQGIKRDRNSLTGLKVQGILLRELSDSPHNFFSGKPFPYYRGSRNIELCSRITGGQFFVNGVRTIFSFLRKEHMYAFALALKTMHQESHVRFLYWRDFNIKEGGDSRYGTLNDLADRSLADEDFGWRKSYQPILTTQP